MYKRQPFEDTIERFRAAVTGPMSLVPLARPALLVAQAEYLSLIHISEPTRPY